MNETRTRAGDAARPGASLLRRVSLAAVVSVIGVLALAALANAGGGTSGKGWAVTYGKYNPSTDDCPKGTTGFKYEPVTSGTKGDGTFSVTLEKRWTSAGATFDFSSNLPVATVFVKGGTKASRYDYDPAVAAGTGLHAPKNWRSGKWFGLSHVIFCYGAKPAPPTALKVVVSKTATAMFTRTHEWKLAKLAKPTKWHLLKGDSGTSTFVVAVKKRGYTDSDWAVKGTIRIKNPATTAATITSVSDTLSGGIDAKVWCEVTFPYTLAPGATLECPYGAKLPNGEDRTNTATVKTSGAVAGGTGTASVKFGDPTKVVNATVTVNDSNGMSWTFADSGVKTYTKTYTCGTGGTFTNTATIVGTGQSASATVVVKCDALEVTKDAKTFTARKWSWTIAKTASPTTLNIDQGKTGSVDYAITLNAESDTSKYLVVGKIRVHNPSSLDAVLESVTDVVSPAIEARVDCGVKFPFRVGAGKTLECTYAASLPDDAGRTNTAAATIRNHDYALDGKSGISGKPSGTTSFTGTAAVSFANAQTAKNKALDECVKVTDSRKGALGTVCAADAKKTFAYTLTFGTKDTKAKVVVGCGETTYPNTASFETSDTKTTGSANASVTVKVACTTTPPKPPAPPKPPEPPKPPAPPAPTIDLVLVKGATSPTPLNGTVTYTLRVTNKGPNVATSVQLADPAPAGISYRSATTTQGACAVTAPLVTCSLGSIGVGQTVTVTIKAKATKVGPLANTATVVGQGGTETNPADNSDSAQTIVPKPLQPPKAGTKKQRTKPAVTACLLMTVTPKAITVDSRPDRVRVLVTAANKRQRGVRVLVRGAGVRKASRTGRRGVAVLMIDARRPGVITVTARERNRQVCGTRRIGVVAAFVAPLTG